MKIQKTELAGKLGKIKGIVPKRTLIPALQGVLITSGKMIANDMELSATLDLECEGDETFILPMKAFEMINSLPDGEIEIVPTDKDVTIKTKKIRNKYAALKPMLFNRPNITRDGAKTFTIDSESFLKSIKRVSFAIDKGESHQIMNCLCLRAKDGKLNYIALDGHVIAWDKADYEGEFELLIPKKAIDRLASMGITGELTIHHNDKGALFITDGCEISTRLVYGQFFQVEKMLEEAPLHTIVEKRSMVDALTRARMCIEGENIPVKMVFSKDEVQISSAKQTSAYNETQELLKDIERELKIAFNSSLLIDSLKSFDEDDVEMSFTNPKSPAVLKAEGTDYLSVVLPVAFKE